MKGIIFNLLEDYLTNALGDDAWETIIISCSLVTEDPLAIVAPGTYADEDFLTITNTAAQRLDQPLETLLKNFGRFILPKLAARYPAFFAHYNHPGTFLKYAGMIHQVEIKKLYNDARTPEFSCQETSTDEVVLTYASQRQLGDMVEGLLEGLADFYQVGTTITRTDKKNDKPVSEFILRFATPMTQ